MTKLRSKITVASLLPALVLAGCHGGGATSSKPVVVAKKSYALGQAPDPTTKPYFNYFEARSGQSETFNNQTLASGARQVQIAGAQVVIDDADANQVLLRINNDTDIKRLDIYAEKVVIRTAIKLPGTEVHIFAEELRFEDTGTTPAVLDTSAPSLTARNATPGAAGANGINGGDIYVYAKTFFSDGNRLSRFIMNGGQGQQGGVGSNGVDGASSVLFRDANTDLLNCAINNGLASRLNQSTTPWSFDPAPISLSDLQNNTVKLGADFPGNGSDATPGGKEGNASNGGNLHTLLTDLTPYAQMDPGLRGLNAGDYTGGKPGNPSHGFKLDSAKCVSVNVGGGISGNVQTRLLVGSAVTGNDAKHGANVSSPSADVLFGQKGTATVDPGQLGWFHPHALAMSIAFAEDAYVNEFRDIALAELNKLNDTLTQLEGSTELTALPSDDQTLFAQQAIRVRTLLNQLASNQDYFGNPIGWVPALSLEANVALFQQEVQWAIRTIFVVDWLTDENNKQKDAAAAEATAKTLLQTEIGQLDAQLNDALGRLPGLKSDAANAGVAKDALDAELKAVDDSLTAEAKADVAAKHELPFWKKALRAVSLAATVIPVGQPILAGLGVLGTAVLDVDSGKSWDAVASDAVDAVKSFAGSDIDAKAKAAKDKKTADAPETKKTQSDLKNAIADINKFVSPVIKALKDHKADFQAASVKKEELDKEVADQLKTLQSHSSIFQTLTAQSKAVMDQRAQLAKNIDSTTQALEEALAKISEHWLQIAELLPKLSTSAAVILTQRSTLALGDMRAKALHRLQKYQYLLSRAYEFRMLKKYAGDLTLTNLFNEVRALVEASDANGALQQAQYDSLFAIYRNELSAIVEEVASNFSAGNAQHVTSVQYNLTADELGRLNAGLAVDFDFWERRLFQDTEEDVRIANVEIVNLQASQVGSSPNITPFFDLITEHSDDSRIWKNGQLSFFRHYNKDTQQKLFWGARWQNGAVTQQPLSSSADSLLHSLLPDANSNIDLFSRPSAWATLTMHKQVHADPGADFTLSAVTVKITYDFSPASSTVYHVRRDAQDASIQSTYQTLLGRAPTAEDLRSTRLLLDLNYTPDMLNDAISRTQAADFFAHRVDGIYQSLYQRLPNDDERSFWGAQLDNHRPEDQVRTYVQEITDTFNEVFGRLPTYDELGTYTGILDSGVPL